MALNNVMSWHKFDTENQSTRPKHSFHQDKRGNHRCLEEAKAGRGQGQKRELESATKGGTQCPDLQFAFSRKKKDGIAGSKTVIIEYPRKLPRNK